MTACRCRIDHGPEADAGFNEERRNAEALFVGRGPGTELDPVHLDGVGADFLGFHDHFARGARMVRGGELVREARVLAHAVLDVLGEAAGGDEDALGGAHVDHLAGVLAAEAVARAGLDADHFLLVVDDDLVDDEAQARLNAEFLELGEHRKDEARARVVRHGVGALDGMGRRGRSRP